MQLKGPAEYVNVQGIVRRHVVHYSTHKVPKLYFNKRERERERENGTEITWLAWLWALF